MKGIIPATCTSVVILILLRRYLNYRRRITAPVTREEHLRILRDAANKNPFHTYSAQKLAELIRSLKATSYEITEAHINHIKSVNGILNAVVCDRFEDALKEAKEADEFIKQRLEQGESLDNLPPLFGVPCTIKECFAVIGMPNASGLVARSSIISDSDATVVRRIKGMNYFDCLNVLLLFNILLDAGAIPMAVTNTSELCMWMER